MIFYALIFLTLLILGGAMWYAYSTTRDPLHPLIYLAPLCIYSYVLKPLLLDYMGALGAFFDPPQLQYVQMVNILGLAAFCLGAVYHARSVTAVRVPVYLTRTEMQKMLTPVVRQRVIEIAAVLGIVANGVYWFSILGVGGLTTAYGHAKGGVNAATGYLGEAPMLCLAAIGLLYLAWAGQRFTAGRIVTLLVVASPLLVHGLLGSRRGPTFMVLGALLIGGFLVSPRRPKLITVFVTVFLLGSLILFLVSNRQRIFLGSGAIEEWSSGSSPNILRNVDVGDDWIHSGGTILTSRNSGTHFWGSRIVMLTFLRPIPKQIWPDKYIATGFGWMEDQDDMLGMTDKEWFSSVGWIPARGAAAGLTADLYLEFAWFGLVGCGLIGWVYSWLWKNMVLKRSIWSVLYLYAAILSIYVPTQNVTDAWLYRMVLLSVPTLLLWHFFVRPVLQGPSAVAPANRMIVSDRRRWGVPHRRMARRPYLPPTGTVPPGFD